ncbi:MAG TPA: type I secretion system permease/ATPase [Xanthobacteraceae bacterium]|jgi:ATP-binding cassette subfamily C protein|uniref:type I secretion system permease/ATPase n=1 Tax=Roseixanthobacter finlandensis TaxID=3119922 RepID=UPI000BCA8438|nr:MAG: type I secretion system permease/ATPase [Azorhizobium sp. 12-66-6]OYY84670.1 MAG: type I secretion system permease/ATPase [Rhizobiales bacterium 35-66-30]OZB09665.1 MAG: type I secretion system permease/ATPase [Rhizobiales bacterium 39-66-18]HQS08099.1 type I secretion system permease/ATPase [Xanthobacteraceae bacterium]HQS49016.1 type I secretion system permease/ATPase [Xanthobacteraceae bacterium]
MPAKPFDTQALIKTGRRTFVAGLVYAAAISAFITMLQLTVPLFMIQVHDRVVNSRSYDTLMMLVIIAVGCLLLYGILEYIRALTFQAMASSLVRRLNLPTLEATLAASVESGTTKASQALRDLSDLRTFITSSAAFAPLEGMWCPIFLVVLFALHPYYGLLAIVSAGILVALGLVSDLFTRQVTREANQAHLENHARIASALRHSEAIEAMGMLPALARRWRTAQIHAAELSNLSNRRGRGVHAVTRVLRLTMQIGALSLGASLVIEGSASPGSMIGATIIMNRLLAPFDSLTDHWRSWITAMSGWQRIRELLENHRSARDSVPTPHCQGDLEVDNLIFMPQGQDLPVLKGIGFRVEPGQILGVVGPSAAGKSTLARLMVGAARPTAGGIYLDGHNVYLWERGSFGDIVGYLPQAVSLLDGTIRDNIARMREPDPRRVIEAARQAGVHEMIGRLPLGYDTPVGDGRFTLSGGQKQRIALARALYGRPRLLVLDEPNANLDAEGEAALMAAMRAARDDGAIVILIAHRPAIMECADKLLVLQEGRIAQFGERTSVVAAITPARGQGAVRKAALAKAGDAA